MSSMFAIAPLIVVGCWVGGSVIVVSILAWMAVRWLKKDPNTDMVIFMGPKEGGKTEFLAALTGESFDPKRPGTGFRFKKIGVKDFVVCDSGGDSRNIKTYVDRIVKEVKEKQPNFVLVILVFDVQDLPILKLSVPDGCAENGKGVSFEQLDKLAEYLDLFTMTCEEESKTGGYFTQKYGNGHWAFAIVGTHLGKTDEKMVTDGLAKMREHLDQYSRKMSYAGTGAFELSEKKMRDSTVCFIKELLKKLHSA